MYTHIGNGNIVKNKDVIGIFQIDTLVEGRDNKKLLLQIQKKEKGNTVPENYKKTMAQKKKECKEFENKSVILTDREQEEEQILISPIAITTLKKRFESP